MDKTNKLFILTFCSFIGMHIVDILSMAYIDFTQDYEMKQDNFDIMLLYILTIVPWLFIGYLYYPSKNMKLLTACGLVLSSSLLELYIEFDKTHSMNILLHLLNSVGWGLMFSIFNLPFISQFLFVLTSYVADLVLLEFEKDNLIISGPSSIIQTIRAGVLSYLLVKFIKV